jgi:serine/threonine protein kinase/Tfp pilus assembly protein PilF
LAQQVDQACNGFEAAWKAAARGGPCPRLEDYLPADVLEPERAVLLQELLALELVYRWKLGGTPTTEEYGPRFPDHIDLISRVFKEMSALRHSDQASVAQTQLVPGEAPADGNGEGSTLSQVDEPPRTPPPVYSPNIRGYEILGELGRGGMGVVFKARQIELKRLVALKMILSGPYASTEELARFRLEAEAAAGLQHSNIVQIYAIGQHKGLPYFCMEFVDGGSLSRRIGGKAQAPEEAARLIEILARAVHHAHEHGFIHRDLKPSNVLLTADGTCSALGTPKITDFGLAKRLEVQDPACAGSEITQTNMILGTPAYMAPEQARGESKRISTRTDVYALGVILYEMLTGRPPFRGTTDLETLDRVRSMEPVPPRRLGLKLQVPRALETICLKCLEKEPGKRYESAKALADDLGRFRSGEPPLAQPTSSVERMVKWAKRKPATAALILVSSLAVLSLIGTGMLYLQSRARAAELVVSAQNEVQSLLSKARSLLSKSREAISLEDLDNAHDWIQAALEKIGPQEILNDFREEAVQLEREVETRRVDKAQQSQRQREERASQATYQKFVAGHDKALFHAAGALSVGFEATGANWEASRAAANEALGLFNLMGGKKLELSQYYDAVQQKRITEGCYELLVILADAVAFADSKRSDSADNAKRAIDLLNQAENLGITTQAMYQLRARCFDLLGNEPEAARNLRKWQETEAKSPLDYFLQGYHWYQQGELPRAIADFECVLDSQEYQFWAHYLLALCQLKRQHPAEAKPHLNASLSLGSSQNRNLIWIYLVRGLTETELGAQGKARAFEAAEADFQKAEGCERDKAANYGLYVNRGVMWIRWGKLDQAADDLKTAVALEPNQFSAYLNLAKAYQEQAHRKVQIRSLLSSLTPPQLSSVIATAALAYCERDQLLGEAERQLDTAIKRKPDLALLHRARTRVHLERQNPQAALKDINVAIAKDGPTSKSQAENYAEQGRVFINLKEHDKAIRACDAALKADQDYVVAHLLRAEALLGRAQAGIVEKKQLEDYREMVASLDQYENHPRVTKPGPEFYRLRGQTEAVLGNHARALADYQQVLKSEPDNSEIYTLCGWTCYALPDLKKARWYFKEATKRDPKNGDAHNGLGFVLVTTPYADPKEEAKMAREAIEEAQKALEYGPTTQRMLYNSARIFAQAARIADNHAKRQLLRSPPDFYHYQRQALKCLSEATDLIRTPAERSAFWEKYVENDDALGLIKDSSEFRRLRQKTKAP